MNSVAMDSSLLLPTAPQQPHLASNIQGPTAEKKELTIPSSGLKIIPPQNVEGVPTNQASSNTSVGPGRGVRSQEPADGYAESRIMGFGPLKSRKTLVLCFDGTGNKFHGDSSDSNILKIFRMLDRSTGTGFHYYQPGIGTYVATASLSSTGTIERLRKWYMKAKDSAIGTSFDQHVVGGYKFLMQYYAPGDYIYMFGFSRGSYTARFLAEMLDWVGLITHGNEEMIQFAWRTFSKWKAINGVGEEARKEQKQAYDFMVSFRETFSRPIKRIRYLGLFDTVNSVPRFENAMMSRPHMPYSAKSSAKVIRHAVSIDERRAKFRSDLISDEGRLKGATDKAREDHLREKQLRHDRHREWFHEPNRYKPKKTSAQQKQKQIKVDRKTTRYRVHNHSRDRSTTGTSQRSASPESCSSMRSNLFDDGDESSDGDESDQDIEELWFPGGHADIGGGWSLEEGEVPLSHVPLVWIVREAKKSGLVFDDDKMRVLGCYDESSEAAQNANHDVQVPIIEVDGIAKQDSDGPRKDDSFKERIFQGARNGKLHDCLAFGQGLPRGSVLSWQIMEWIPFKRMDLRPDGSWKPIRWPLPRGEVRDMPDNAKVHHSALTRMKADPKYRPGNLIMGGGGRGVRIAPKEAGIGEWVLCKEEGDHVGECFVRKPKVREGEENRAENGGENGEGK